MATTKKRKRATKQQHAERAPAASSALAMRSRPVTLVTGGTGFLGRHLLRELIEAGTPHLRVMSTAAPGWLRDLNVEVLEGSVTRREDVEQAVSGVADIYHLAGRVSRDPEDAHEMYELHVEGTRVLCDAARAAGVGTVVLGSTSGTIAVTDRGDTIPDETWPPPVDIISRWPYYASKYYQERAATESFSGSGRLVIMNPSLLLGPGDDRLSSTGVVLDFMARKISATPSGGLSFVDVRDAARAFVSAMKRGRHGERYLLGSVNYTFRNFFGRLERLTKVSAPRFTLPSKIAVGGAQVVDALFRKLSFPSPVEPTAVEMAEFFWYLNAGKAARELGFAPRDPAETLQDTIRYLRENFLGNDAFRSQPGSTKLARTF